MRPRLVPRQMLPVLQVLQVPPIPNKMNLNEYQQECAKTAIFPHDSDVTYLSLALCGEAGELADKVKKIIRDRDGLFTHEDHIALALELGDALWYAANLARALDFTLDEVAQMNLNKIQNRLLRGTIHGSGDNR